MPEKPERFVLCYRAKEDHVYKPLVDKREQVYAVPLGVGQEKIADSASEMILLDLEPINEKLRDIRKYMKLEIDSCKRTVEQHKDTKEGKAYAVQYDSVAKCLERYLKQIEEALPQLKDEPE